MVIFIAIVAFLYAVVVERLRKKYRVVKLANLLFILAAFGQLFFSSMLSNAVAFSIASTIYAVFLIIVSIKDLIKQPSKKA